MCSQCSSGSVTQSTQFKLLPKSSCKHFEWFKRVQGTSGLPKSWKYWKFHKKVYSHKVFRANTLILAVCMNPIWFRSHCFSWWRSYLETLLVGSLPLIFATSIFRGVNSFCPTILQTAESGNGPLILLVPHMVFMSLPHSWAKLPQIYQRNREFPEQAIQKIIKLVFTIYPLRCVVTGGLFQLSTLALFYVQWKC